MLPYDKASGWWDSHKLKCADAFLEIHNLLHFHFVYVNEYKPTCFLLFYSTHDEIVDNELRSFNIIAAKNIVIWVERSIVL